MANINIYEVSQNYSYTIGNSSYATVALPITSCWGPGYFDPKTFLGEVATPDEMLEQTQWIRYPATQAGLESFVSAYRGPVTNYRSMQDYSYNLAITLMTAGYDVLVCRMSPGARATGGFATKEYSGSHEGVEGTFTFIVKAKYPGSFGNNLKCVLKKVLNRNYWNLIVYAVDANGTQTAVENLLFVFEVENSTDTILHISEVESQYVDFIVPDGIFDDSEFTFDTTTLTSGSDLASLGEEKKPADYVDEAIKLATSRYTGVGGEGTDYLAALNSVKSAIKESDVAKGNAIYFREWVFTHLAGYKGNSGAFDLLKDRLAYNHNRIILPAWDDQDTLFLTGEYLKAIELSPLHIRLMDLAYFCRCATSYIDVPRALPRSKVYNEATDDSTEGYAQKVGRFLPDNAAMDTDSSLYNTHSAFFAPWSQYTYVGTGKKNIASPSFLALMIERAQILNQSIQYEWALPSNRKHNVKVGKLDYIVPKKLLDQWQKLEGVGVNVLANIPDLGINIWGNSTTYEVPPATYQALANLSTRKLVNAIKDVVYRVGISITFQYNNATAYDKFYAGCTPILDTMVNVGAIEGYRIQMSADINGMDQINANSVVGKIWLAVNGVINDIKVDLICLPPNVDLNSL